MALIAAVLAIAAPSNHDVCHSRACVERVATRRCENGSIHSCIHRGALRWRVSYLMLLRKARCESQLRWWARNPSGASGPFQFMPSTWATTPYARRSLWRWKWASLGAGWMHSVGRGGEWACK